MVAEPDPCFGAVGAGNAQIVTVVLASEIV